MNTKITGEMGETAALNYFLDNGYEFEDKNYRSQYGEIDIIVHNDKYIVFAEVKTRNQRSLARPSEFIGHRKRKRILTTAVIYISENPTNLQPRFDAVEVFYDDDGRLAVNHIENAFDQSEEYAAF